jgi:hypothetical protein
MITEAFQVILKYVAPGQEDIVIQNVCKKLSFASNVGGFKICPGDISAACFHSVSILNTVSPGTDFSNF